MCARVCVVLQESECKGTLSSRNLEQLSDAMQVLRSWMAQVFKHKLLHSYMSITSATLSSEFEVRFTECGTAFHSVLLYHAKVSVTLSLRYLSTIEVKRNIYLGRRIIICEEIVVVLVTGSFFCDILPSVCIIP